MPASPWSALEVKTVAKAERQGLSLVGWVKGTVHGWQQADLIDPELCHGCGACVRVCPERVVTLVPRP